MNRYTKMDKAFAPLYYNKPGEVCEEKTIPRLDLCFLKKKVKKPILDSAKWLEDLITTKSQDKKYSKFFEQDAEGMFSTGTASRLASQSSPKKKFLTINNIENPNFRNKLLKNLEILELNRKSSDYRRTSTIMEQPAKSKKSLARSSSIVSEDINKVNTHLKDNPQKIIPITRQKTLKMTAILPEKPFESKIMTGIESESEIVSDHSEFERTCSKYYESFTLEVDTSSVIFDQPKPEPAPVRVLEKRTEKFLLLGQKAAMFTKSDPVLQVKAKVNIKENLVMQIPIRKKKTTIWTPLHITNGKILDLEVTTQPITFHSSTDKNMYSKIRRISKSKILMQPLNKTAQTQAHYESILKITPYSTKNSNLKYAKFY